MNTKQERFLIIFLMDLRLNVFTSGKTSSPAEGNDGQNLPIANLSQGHMSISTRKPLPTLLPYPALAQWPPSHLPPRQSRQVKTLHIHPMKIMDMKHLNTQLPAPDTNSHPPIMEV
jgi:hypothetical protein